MRKNLFENIYGKDLPSIELYNTIRDRLYLFLDTLKDKAEAMSAKKDIVAQVCFQRGLAGVRSWTHEVYTKEKESLCDALGKRPAYLTKLYTILVEKYIVMFFKNPGVDDPLAYNITVPSMSDFLKLIYFQLPDNIHIANMTFFSLDEHEKQSIFQHIFMHALMLLLRDSCDRITQQMKSSSSTKVHSNKQSTNNHQGAGAGPGAPSSESSASSASRLKHQPGERGHNMSKKKNNNNAASSSVEPLSHYSREVLDNMLHPIYTYNLPDVQLETPAPMSRQQRSQDSSRHQREKAEEKQQQSSSTPLSDAFSDIISSKLEQLQTPQEATSRGRRPGGRPQHHHMQKKEHPNEEHSDEEEPTSSVHVAKKRKQQHVSSSARRIPSSSSMAPMTAPPSSSSVSRQKQDRSRAYPTTKQHGPSGYRQPSKETEVHKIKEDHHQEDKHASESGSDDDDFFVLNDDYEDEEDDSDEAMDRSSDDAPRSKQKSLARRHPPKYAGKV